MPTGQDLLLSVNAGSSSLKISLYIHNQHVLTSKTELATEPLRLLLISSISSISSPPARFSFSQVDDNSSSSKDTSEDSIHDHASAFAHFLSRLAEELSIDRQRIRYICHRVVHGGDYNEPIKISKETYHHIEKLSDLAPLHNGAALSVIKSCVETLPAAGSIAYFDTTFHRSIPRHISSYAIDQKIATDRGLKKYGFHGLSCSLILASILEPCAEAPSSDAFIHRSVASHFEKSPESLNLIVLHLGSGASVCAIKQGRSLDTSMGLTPLTGLPGATRSGAIDPSLIFHYTNKAGRITHDPSIHVGVTKAEDILNRQAGWKAIAGTTDFGQITQRAVLENHDPLIAETNSDRLAFDLFVDRILNYVGAYYLKLGGKVDALVFAGGIGEKSVDLRRIVGERIECLGFAPVHPQKNSTAMEKNVVFDISIDKTYGEPSQRVLVCKTDEQLEMARQCVLDNNLWN